MSRAGSALVDRSASMMSVLLVAGIAVLLALLSRSIEFQGDDAAVKAGGLSPPDASQQFDDNMADGGELGLRFNQAVAMLHAKRYEFAITALHRVIELSPQMPEAYVNMGYAMLGLQRYDAARDFFDAATEIKPFQGNAYWGLAVALENLGDVAGALGAMRTYVHLAAQDPDAGEYVRRARSAIWEWETSLQRGPLPPEEAEWVARRGAEWEERNNPGVDAPIRGELSLGVLPAP